MEISRLPLKTLRALRARALLAALILVCPNAHAEDPTLQVIVLEGGNSLDFGHLRSLDNEGAPLSEASSRRVRLQVMNPDRLSFVISQIVNMEPVNQNGTSLSADAIRFRAGLENGAGTLLASQKELLQTGLQEIYESADNDQNMSLVIVYDFLVPPGQKAGQYQSSITYRLDVR